MVREIFDDELEQLLNLYLDLYDDKIREKTIELKELWKKIIKNENYHIIVKVLEGQIVSSCICVIVPDLARSLRPYAVIENVVTSAQNRGLGYASECLTYAVKIAKRENCYKMMLLTDT